MIIGISLNSFSYSQKGITLTLVRPFRSYSWRLIFTQVTDLWLCKLGFSSHLAKYQI